MNEPHAQGQRVTLARAFFRQPDTQSSRLAFPPVFNGRAKEMSSARGGPRGAYAPFLSYMYHFEHTIRENLCARNSNPARQSVAMRKRSREGSGVKAAHNHDLAPKNLRSHQK